VGDSGIEVRDGDGWMEGGEAGLALRAILDEAGLPSSRWSGLAMGLGLDPAADADQGDGRHPRAALRRPRASPGQVLDHRPVSSQPPIRRDLSVAVKASRTPGEAGRARGEPGIRRGAARDAVRRAAARERIGIVPGQKNVLVRIVIRDLVRILTRAEANALRDAVYASLHEGGACQWASAAG
jgi:phenylalanyl-tRNA synthetase alpha chain